MEILIKTRNKFNRIAYKILKKVLFQIDPEKVHDSFTKIGYLLGSNFITKNLIKILFNYKNKRLEQTIHGIKFKNPVGLAAGFDKDSELTQIIPNVGFGFEEIGSITALPYEGNPRPRLIRLKNSKGLVVNYGLKSKGAEYMSKKLKKLEFKIPIGISIAKTNNLETTKVKNAIKDYAKCYNTLKEFGDYITINISCPNLCGKNPIEDAKNLDELLSKIIIEKPIFLKISPDLSNKQVDSLIKVANKYHLAGFICSNLTKNRNNKNILDKNIPDQGGISGKPVEELSNKQIKYIYSKTKGKLIIIGCGGIFSAEDAYKKIKSGASLIQLITGMIYEGPQLISEINQGLVKLLEKDGFDNISQVVGIDKA